jgi:hypothetical protein
MTVPVGRERDFVGYGGRAPDPKWPGDARLALNLVVNYEEGRSRRLGTATAIVKRLDGRPQSRGA